MQKTKTALLQCSVCGTITPLARKKGKQKKEGHVKHLWCFKCKAETMHEEKKEY